MFFWELRQKMQKYDKNFCEARNFSFDFRILFFYVDFTFFIMYNKAIMTNMMMAGNDSGLTELLRWMGIYSRITRFYLVIRRLAKTTFYSFRKQKVDFGRFQKNIKKRGKKKTWQTLI